MRAGIIEYRALLVRGVPFFFVVGRSDMTSPKADRRDRSLQVDT